MIIRIALQNAAEIYVAGQLMIADSPHIGDENSGIMAYWSPHRQATVLEYPNDLQDPVWYAAVWACAQCDDETPELAAAVEIVLKIEAAQKLTKSPPPKDSNDHQIVCIEDLCEEFGEDHLMGVNKELAKKTETGVKLGHDPTNGVITVFAVESMNYWNLEYPFSVGELWAAITKAESYGAAYLEDT